MINFILKYCVIALVVGSGVVSQLSAAMPSYQGFINDYTKTLSPSTKQRLSTLSERIENASGIEVVTAIISTTGPDTTIDTYAVDLFEAWGIGKKNQDNGVLLLLAIDDRKVRIEVGYGLEAILTDAQAGQLLDSYVMPNLRTQQLNKAIIAGHVAMSTHLIDKLNLSISDAPQPSKNARKASVGIGPLLALILIFFFFRRRGSGLLPLLLLMGLSSGRSSHGFGSFGGSGMSGFGGFGGGLSGGGGASRGW